VTVEERAIGAATILDVRGRMTVDATDNDRLTDTVRGLLARGRTQIVLNLQRVSQIDSSGLCDIVTAYTATVRQDGSLKLLHLTPRVRDLLTITKIITILEVYDSEASALASFEPGPSV
jgi:anti-sigma B factor antagonist